MPTARSVAGCRVKTSEGFRFTLSSGEEVSQHRSVKKGDMLLKRFLCIAVQGVLRPSRETSIKRFYEKKAIGTPKAQIGAARKLACANWWMLSHHEEFKHQHEPLTERKARQMESISERSTPEVTEEDLDRVEKALEERNPTLNRLTTEVVDVD
jgi:hypothetical protein